MNREEILLEEFKTLRSEIIENMKARSWILLYITIIIASVMGIAFQSGNMELTSLILPLMFPLLIWWNALYLANFVINSYITSYITNNENLKYLKWEKLASRQRKIKLGIVLKIHTAPGIAIIFTTMGLIPPLYLLSKELSLTYILIATLNVFLGVIVLYSVFYTKRILEPVINEINDYLKTEGKE